jgi:alpha-L-fucosidase
MMYLSFCIRFKCRYAAIVGFSLILLITSGCSVTEKAPAPFGAVPSERQLDHERMEMYAFLHFNMNTFTNKEWGYGDESPTLFNPTDFDADQIVGTLARAGFKGVILTAKHHDGFCLWPSAYTEHSVKNSPWKDGKGDVVRAISDACKKYGIKFGVYLSPWDRNRADYGTASYITYYKSQLRELLTHYGNIFEVWFDGANGGSGYYGGSREVRKIDKDNYYPWDSLYHIVRTLQPSAVMFSDAGPDLRWVGNEKGYANDTCWETYTPMPKKGFKHAYAGNTQARQGEKGTMNGKYWMPAEADVSIRRGWFYHPDQDPKSLAQLVSIYFNSVGNGALLNLNVPPNRAGRISPEDSARLMEFKKYLDEGYRNNFLAGSQASVAGPDGKTVSTPKLTDGKAATYWAAPSDTSYCITFKLDRPSLVNCLMMQEYIRTGQRVASYTVEVSSNDHWEKVAAGATIGYKKLVHFPDVKASSVRITINKGLAPPVLDEVALYRFPDIEQAH